MRGDTIHDTVQHTTQALLRHCRTPQTVFAIMESAAQHANALVAQASQRTTHACAAGCDFCCHMPVDITALEALSIAAYLQTTLTPEALTVLRQRLAATAARVQGLSFEAQAQAKQPCALLVDGRCAVYPQRPLACRAWTSTSRRRCEEIFHGDPLTMLPPLDLDLYAAVWSVARGVADGVKQARLDGQTYELHSILHRILTTPEAAQRWLQGDAIFATCTGGAFNA